MEKPNPYLKEFLKDSKIIDQNAASSAELSEMRKEGRACCSKFIKKKLESGEFEQVYKVYNGRTIKAYRPIIKRKK